MGQIDKIKCCKCDDDAEWIYYVPYREVDYVGPYAYDSGDDQWEDRRGHPGIYWWMPDGNDPGPPDFKGYYPQLRCGKHCHPRP